MRGSGQIFQPSRPALYSPSSIFTQDATKLARASSQVEATRLAALFSEHKPIINYSQFEYSVYYVNPKTPRQHVYLFTEGEELAAPGAKTGLETAWNSNGGVPVPSEIFVPKHILYPAGTDKTVCIICPATGEIWEFWQWTQFEKGTLRGKFKAKAGAYLKGFSSFNGVWNSVQVGAWGVNAAGLGLLGGALTQSDIVRMARGEAIGHALTCAVYAAQEGHFAPATRNDSRETSNPNAVKEGLACVFPNASHASDFSLTGMRARIFDAIRDHSLMVNDSGGSNTFQMTDIRGMWTPYAEGPVNWVGAYAASSPSKAELETLGGGPVLAKNKDPTLPAITEGLHEGWLTGLPWSELEQLEERAS